MLWPIFFGHELLQGCQVGHAGWSRFKIGTIRVTRCVRPNLVVAQHLYRYGGIDIRPHLDHLAFRAPPCDPHVHKVNIPACYERWLASVFVPFFRG